MLLELVPGEAIALSGLKEQSREWFPEVAGRETEPLHSGGMQSGGHEAGREEDKDRGLSHRSLGPGWCPSLAEPTGKLEGGASVDVGHRGQSLGHGTRWRGVGGLLKGQTELLHWMAPPVLGLLSSRQPFLSPRSSGSLRSSSWWHERPLPQSHPPDHAGPRSSLQRDKDFLFLCVS